MNRDALKSSHNDCEVLNSNVSFASVNANIFYLFKKVF